MTRTKHKKTNWPKGVSDTMLLDLCREVVRKEWEGVCGFSDFSECDGPVEWHHIKPRRIPHLRYSPSNGILLCQYHHNLIKYRVWRTYLENTIGPEKMEWLDIMEQKLFPAFLAEKGQTRGEYLLAQRDYLRALLAVTG